MADLATRVTVLEDWRNNTADLHLKSLDARVSVNEGTINAANGAFGVIKWLLGVNTALLVGLALWALSHLAWH